MSVKSTIIGETVRATGVLVASAGVQRFRPGTTRGVGLYVSGTLLEKIPALINPDGQSAIGDLLVTTKTIRAASEAKNKDIVGNEPLKYIGLRRMSSFSIRAATGTNMDRIDTLGELADDASIVAGILADKLESENDIGFSSLTNGASKFAHLASTAILARSVLSEANEAGPQPSAA